MAKPIILADSILGALPSELSRRLFAQGRLSSLDADQTLFLAGDEGDGCYRVEEGLLKASVAAPNGGERILAILGPRSVVGELSMIDGAPRSASVTALRNSKLCFISQADFDAIGKSSPEIYRHVMKVLARRLRDTNNALAASSFLSLKGRVARALLSLAEAFGKDVGNGRILIQQKVNQSDLAAMAGIAREKRQPRAQGLDRARDGKPACWLLLPREEGRHPARSLAVMRSRGVFRSYSLTPWLGWEELELANVAFTRRDLHRSLSGVYEKSLVRNVLENQGVRPSVL